MLPLLFAAFFLFFARADTVRQDPNTAKAASADAACASCHRAVCDHYEATPMARASGLAMDGMLEGGFLHGASGVRYRMFAANATSWLEFSRPQSAPGGFLSGKLELKYFIGSNNRGRTYLFQRDGYWFETPVNWYAKRQLWDMAPNYLDAHEMPLTLPVDANCLHCHVTRVAAALPGAEPGEAYSVETRLGMPAVSFGRGDGGLSQRPLALQLPTRPEPV